jgi:hypothetical protein
MGRHTNRVVILSSLLVSISLLTINSYGQGGSAEKTPPQPSTKQPTRSSQPVKRGTTSSRGSRSTSTANEADESSATLEETLNWIGARLTDLTYFTEIIVGGDFVLIPKLPNLGKVEDIPASPSYKIDGCTITMERTYKYGNGVLEGGQRLVIPFADIDPRTIKFDYTVDIQAVNPTFKFIEKENGWDVTSSKISFWGENLKSFEKAVRHAVKLCASKRKKDLF